MTTQAAGARKWGGELDPPAHAPPRCGVAKERTPPPAGGGTEAVSTGWCLLPHGPLTADR